MRLTLLHPPHTAIGSHLPRENLPPFSLLCIGGPLIDAGHDVRRLTFTPTTCRFGRFCMKRCAIAPTPC